MGVDCPRLRFRERKRSTTFASTRGVQCTCVRGLFQQSLLVSVLLVSAKSSPSRLSSGAASISFSGSFKCDVILRCATAGRKAMHRPPAGGDLKCIAVLSQSSPPPSSARAGDYARLGGHDVRGSHCTIVPARPERGAPGVHRSEWILPPLSSSTLGLELSWCVEGRLIRPCRSLLRCRHRMGVPRCWRQTLTPQAAFASRVSQGCSLSSSAS
jgi:hypothetical protein